MTAAEIGPAAVDDRVIRPSRTRRFQILSLDGGGLKGLFSAAVLAELENDLNASVDDHFDLIVGTSTGGLIALGLGAGLRPADIVDFYADRGPYIFGAGRGVVRRLWAPKHSAIRLREALEAIFGEQTLGASRKRLVIPAYSLDRNDVYVFKTPHHERLTRDWRELMVDVAMATTAAPTFLPAFGLRHHRLVDGGVWASNPALVGVAEAVSMLGIALENIRVLSLGTTDELTDPPNSLDQGGLWQWARAAAPLVLRAQSVGSFHAVEHLIGPTQVLRIDPIVPAGLFRLDRIDRRRIRGLAEDVSRRAAPSVKAFTKQQADPYIPLHGKTNIDA
jgi:uncharacterized protein